MADPFEVRLRFTDMLASMTASNTASQKVAQYLLKNKSLSEDLHSCIIEQVDQNNDMNIRANILCFIEVFLDAAFKDPHAQEYITMMQRDLPHIVKAATPHSSLGQINLTIVRLVMQNLQRKQQIPPEVSEEISEWLGQLESAIAAGKDPLDLEYDNSVAINLDSLEPSGVKTDESADPWSLKMERKQAEKRMEEDRERHKRLRESIWAVTSEPGEKEEWEKIWEETSDFGEDDYRLAKEEAEEKKGVLSDYCEHWREKIAKQKAGSAVQEESADVEMAA